jgi:hypothetical protein
MGNKFLIFESNPFVFLLHLQGGSFGLVVAIAPQIIPESEGPRVEGPRCARDYPTHTGESRTRPCRPLRPALTYD